MSATPTSAAQNGLTAYLSTAQARSDRWRGLHRVAKALAAGSPKADALRAQALQELDALVPLEDLCAYPGPALMAIIRERVQTGDWAAFARLVQRVSISLLSNSYRDSAEAWSTDEESDAHKPE